MDFQKHYKNHLSKFYSWMFGNFENMVDNQQKLLKNHGIQSTDNSIAIDLGCGPGFQSLALKNLGFEVYAVDLSSELLDELREKETSIKIRQADIRDLSFATKLKPDLIVCMGDTLTHLSSLEEVNRLIADSFKILRSEGKLLFSYRDLSVPLADTDRFFIVQSDEKRILTCFLEEEFDKVKVTDLLHEKTKGKWILRKSSYHKIKIPKEHIEHSMRDNGFEVKMSRLPNGMLIVQGLKH